MEGGRGFFVWRFFMSIPRRPVQPDRFPCGSPGWCFWCYRNRKFGPGYVGHWGLRTARRPKRRLGFMPIDKPAAPGETVISEDVCECPLLLKVPTVYDYLTEEKFSDGSKRVPSTLSFFVEGRYLKVSLNDRHNERGLYLAGESVEGLLVALEGLLEAGNPPWRAWPSKRKGK